MEKGANDKLYGNNIQKDSFKKEIKKPVKPAKANYCNCDLSKGYSEKGKKSFKG